MSTKTPELHAFDRRLRHFFWHDTGLAILNGLSYQWYDGACWLAADGLLRWALLESAQSAYQSLVIELCCLGTSRCDVEHVLVHVGDWYLDAYGVRSATHILAVWRRQEFAIAPFITPFRLDRVTHHGIPCPSEQRQTQLVQTLQASLGPFPLALFLPHDPLGPVS